MDEDKEMERLRRLHEEYDKQKERMIKIMEVRCKIISTRKVANNLKVNFSYLYKVFAGTYISYEKLYQLYSDILTITKVLGADNE